MLTFLIKYWRKHMSKIYSTKEILLEKMKHFCSYQERCHKEVLDKMFSLKIDAEWRDEILLDLMRDDFINEERYARSIVRGKLHGQPAVTCPRATHLVRSTS